MPLLMVLIKSNCKYKCNKTEKYPYHWFWSQLIQTGKKNWPITRIKREINGKSNHQSNELQQISMKEILARITSN